MTASDPIDAAVAGLTARNIRYVRFELPDLHGVSRSKVVPVDQMERYARRGLNMYGGTIALDTASSVVGGSGLNEEINYRDQQLIPDLSTLTRLPWLDDTARVICDSQWRQGEPLTAAPRHVFRRVLDIADTMGFDVLSGHEFEFYLLDGQTRDPLFNGVHIFNSVRNNWVPFLDTVLDDLQALGLEIITHNCEYAPSQYEVNYRPARGLAAGDRAFTFRNAIKELAHRAGYLATFMSKPASDLAGCGCHVHMSLLHRDSGANAFIDSEAHDGMSELMGSFVQGILDHAPALMAICAPTPNCYRRLRPHTFAPSNVSWGVEDRSAMVRIKDTATDNIHAELRAPSAMSNPYLSAAAMLTAGLAGIRAGSRLRPQAAGPSEDNAGLEKLPPSLDAALVALEADAVLREGLGEDFIRVFTAVKRHELARFHAHVSDWERDEYLEVY